MIEYLVPVVNEFPSVNFFWFVFFKALSYIQEFFFAACHRSYKLIHITFSFFSRNERVRIT